MSSFKFTFMIVVSLLIFCSTLGQDLAVKLDQLEMQLREQTERVQQLSLKVEEQANLIDQLTIERNAISVAASARVKKVTGMPTSCSDLSVIGHTLNNFYSVKDLTATPSKIKKVYCDFSKASTDPSFQTDIGHEKVAHSVYFYVQKNSFTTVPGVITFEVARLNIGNAMNIKTGIFTAPKSGIYFFLFSGLKEINSNGGRLEIRLQINGSFNVALAWFSGATTSTSGINFGGGLHSTLHLNAGDTVALVLKLGVLYDNPWDYYSHFSGWLLEEDLNF